MISASITQPTRQTLENLERSRRLAETQQVLAQPHRRGNDGDMVDPLGRFVTAFQCGRECYEAGWDYYRLVYRWRRAAGIPNDVRLDEVSNAGGGELEGDAVHDWLAKIKACEFELKRSGLPGFRAAQALLLEGVFPGGKDVQPVKRGLRDLAVELGKFPA